MKISLIAKATWDVPEDDESLARRLLDSQDEETILSYIKEASTRCFEELKLNEVYAEEEEEC